MKPKSYKYSIFFLLLIMAGCNSRAGNSYTSTSTPGVIPSVSQTPTLSLTAEPSMTLSSSDLTQENFMYAAWTALEARNVKCKGGFQLELPMEILGRSNAEWTVFTCSPPPQNNREGKGASGPVDYGTRYTQFTKTDLSQSWVIEHKSFNYSAIDRQDALLNSYRWTADGKYVYLFPVYYPGPGGGPSSRMLRTGVSSLYRFNLETGDFRPATPDNSYSAMEISPNDQYLVYSDWDEPDRIHLWDLENNKESSVKLNQDVIASGGFVWGVDSEFVVFVAAQASGEPASGDDMASTSIFVLTIKNMNVREILSKDDRVFITHDCFDGYYWSDQNTICLYTLTDDPDNWNKYFSINVKTGEVVFLRSHP